VRSLPLDPEPLRLEPIFSPRIWGARSLAPLFPEKSELSEPLGEAWLTGLDCKIIASAFRGKTLADAWRDMPVEWRGAKFAGDTDFPLLVKFIFPKDMLSLQVHPDDAYASVHERAAGGRGKTEMWHIVSAEPGARILLGLKPGVDKKAFLAGLENRTLESLFQPVPVQAGDTIFVPARTQHAIGPGVIVCEVQEYSDLTYRVYDFGRLDPKGRPRELHIEKALEVTHFGATLAGKTAALPLPAEDGERSLLAACRYFATERWKVALPATIPMDPDHFDLLVVLSGRGVLRTQDFAFPCEPGECWFLPANLKEYHFMPTEPATFIRTYVPHIPALREELQCVTQGTAASRTVFD
jgi:mannose-6-phosphate isomerase